MLIRTSAKAGENAAERLMTELANSPVHAAIDQGTVVWTVSAVRHSIEHGLYAVPGNGPSRLSGESPRSTLR